MEPLTRLREREDAGILVNIGFEYLVTSNEEMNRKGALGSNMMEECGFVEKSSIIPN